jgi:hypothetical protein
MKFDELSEQAIQRMSSTAADDIIAALESRYTPGLGTERQILVTDGDVEEWSERVGLPSDILYDALALRLALGFHSNALDFGFCDQVVNELHGVIMLRNEGRPELFWSVFLAFDAGEYYHNGDRNNDPVETYTRPQIEQIVKRHTPRR